MIFDLCLQSIQFPPTETRVIGQQVQLRKFVTESTTRRERRRDPSFPIFANALSFNKDELRNVFRGNIFAEFHNEFFKRVALYCMLTPDQNS
jgi:hypothetical protein